MEQCRAALRLPPGWDLLSVGGVDNVPPTWLQRWIEATAPRLYPEYAPDYYAIFFSDPDGIRLEIVANRRFRDLIREKWGELTEFENPLQKAGLA